jgi:COMPASS component SWD2
MTVIIVILRVDFNFTILSSLLDDIRYLSVHDNKYLRYFRGHKSKVTQLALSPLNDTFLSVAPSESLCLWDLRTAHLQGRLNLSPSLDDPQALAAFDPQGLIFAVASGSKYLRLYDARNWDRGAFTTFEIASSDSDSASPIKQGHWNNLQFSPDGKEILIGTGLLTTIGIVLDSFDGNVKGTIESPDSVHFNDLAYTSDSKFVLGARSDGQLNVWIPSNPKTIVETIEGISKEPIYGLAFNPKFAMLAAVGDGTVFYI